MSTIYFKHKARLCALYWSVKPPSGLYGTWSISPVGNWEERDLNKQEGRTLSNDEIRFASGLSDASDTRYPVFPLAQLIRSQVSW